MCTVSKIIEYGQNNIGPDDWNRQNWMSFTNLLRQAETFDSLTNQPDCADPAKLEWMRKIEHRVRKVEQERLPRQMDPLMAAGWSMRTPEVEALEKRVADLESRLAKDI